LDNRFIFCVRNLSFACGLLRKLYFSVTRRAVGFCKWDREAKEFA
jgi:hypothetical protein